MRNFARLRKKYVMIFVGALCLIFAGRMLLFFWNQEPRSNREFIVCIDPGHGGYDTGAIGMTGLKEKEINLKVAQKLSRILTEKQIKLIHTRNSDTVSWPSIVKEDLRARCKISDEADASVFISIHCNADSSSPNTRGVETWCKSSGSSSKKLAGFIQEELKAIRFTSSRGLKYDSESPLYVLKNVDAVPVLVELGFLSNLEDSRFLETDEGQEKCARALANAVLNYKEKVY